MFSNVHRSVNVRKLSCVLAFSEVLLCFSCIFPTSKRAWIQVNACFPMFTVRWTFGKYRVFPCSQEISCIFWDSEFGWIQENACFLAFTVKLMGGKLREFERISSRFLAFPGTEYSGVFQCHRPALFAHSLSQSEQQKQKRLLILKIWFI